MLDKIKVAFMLFFASSAVFLSCATKEEKVDESKRYEWGRHPDRR